MSADLFAAFGQAGSSNQGTSQERATSQNSETKASQDIFSLQSGFDDASLDEFGVRNQSAKEDSLNPWIQSPQEFSHVLNADAEDEWGEFEDAAPSESHRSLAYTSPPNTNTFRTFDVPEDQGTWNASVSSNTARELSATWRGAQDLTPEPVKSQKMAETASLSRVMQTTRDEVLFDAEEELDEFGDFETGASELLAQSSTPLQYDGLTKPQASSEPFGYQEDLISISVDQPTVEQGGREKATERRLPSSRTKAGVKAPSTQTSKITQQEGKIHRNKLQKKSAFRPLPNATSDDVWDEFEETAAPGPALEANPARNSLNKHDDTDVQTFSASLVPPLSRALPLHPNDVPPTNIPPPAVLLSLLPLLFSELHMRFFQPLAGQSPSAKARILSGATTVEYLQGWLGLAVTGAHIIAGRKLRWKRDTFLSQGMRIGPAGRSGGMKLTGIDKSEKNKEEREVVDVVRAWREHAGRLRSAVTAAQSAFKARSMGAIPDIQETMVVKTAKQADGGVPAPHQCALCGLKRDERVHQVDYQVRDSFGEWWIEQVSMHKDCRSFWEEQKDSIRQR